MANAVEVKNVTMEFNMSKEKVDSIKEYFIKLVKRELHFEQFLALKDVSVTIEQGDVFGIVGLNGSGKSTLLKVISGILKPTKGTVKTVGTISPMIELGAGFDMDLTARENIFLNGTMLGFSEEEINARLDEILAVGDFLFQQKCEKRIREMMDRGTTVIIVSHTIEQIERLCKHVLWLEHGNMKMLGDTKTVCDAYKAI